MSKVLEIVVTFILFIITLILLTFFSLSLVGITSIPFTAYAVSTDVNVSGGPFFPSLGYSERIDSPDSEIIKRTVDANNFLKRAIGIGFILLIIGIVTFRFYREWNKNRRRQISFPPTTPHPLR